MQEDDPDLDEMETTTLRNRGKRPGRSSDPDLNRGPGPVAPKKSRKQQAFPMHEEQPDEGDNPFEGTAPLKKSRSASGNTSMPPPRRSVNKGFDGDDAPPSKGGGKGGGKGGAHGIAIIISPMSNHAEDHRSSVRDSISKSIGQIKRRK